MKLMNLFAAVSWNQWSHLQLWKSPKVRELAWIYWSLITIDAPELLLSSSTTLNRALTESFNRSCNTFDKNFLP